MCETFYFPAKFARSLFICGITNVIIVRYWRLADWWRRHQQICCDSLLFVFRLFGSMQNWRHLRLMWYWIGIELPSIFRSECIYSSRMSLVRNRERIRARSRNSIESVECIVTIVSSITIRSIEYTMDDAMTPTTLKQTKWDFWKSVSSPNDELIGFHRVWQICATTPVHHILNRRHTRSQTQNYIHFDAFGFLSAKNQTTHGEQIQFRLAMCERVW